MKSARVIPRSHAGFWQNISNTRQIINMENGQFRNQEIKLKSLIACRVRDESCQDHFTLGSRT